MSEDASYEVEVPVIGASFFIDVSGVFIEGFRLEVYNIGRAVFIRISKAFSAALRAFLRRFCE